MFGSNDKDRDPLEIFIRDNHIDVESVEKFKEELHDHALDTIDNRITTQAGKIPNELLYQYSENLFCGRRTGVKREPKQSEKCVLQVYIYKAEGLAPKDVNGQSDPYCMLGLSDEDNFVRLKSKKQATKYVTSVQMKNLNPEWNECIELPVHRDQIGSFALHIQVWDYDDADSMTTTIGTLKNVKGVRGMGRYMKEVAQTMSKKDDGDDFMGYSTLPLDKIPLDGIDKWFQLRPNSALQGISGRIKIRAQLLCPHILLVDRGHPGKSNQIVNPGRVPNRFPNDVIYGGILTMIVHGRHNIFKELVAEDKNSAVDGWDGKLQLVDDILLQEFATQRKVDCDTRTIAKWEVYNEEHTKLPDGIQMQFMTSLLKELEEHNENVKANEINPIMPIAGRGEKATVFVFDRLSTSLDKFLRHCHRKIVNHFGVYPIKANDTVMRLGELLLSMKTLREMKLYLTARLVDTTMFGSGDVSQDITSSLRESVSKFYWNLCKDLEVIDANVANLDEANPIKRYNVPGLVTLVNEIRGLLFYAQNYYQPAFTKILNTDYMAVVLGTISHRLSDDLRNILGKINKVLNVNASPVEEGSTDSSAVLFQLYLSLRDFADLIEKINGGQVITDEGHKISAQMANVNKKLTGVQALQGFHIWFRPTILRWLHMARHRTIQRLTAAVELDKVERLDDIVKHSSSAVDAVACLNSVVTFWLQIRWPDPIDGFLIATRMIEDISNGVELYADLVHNKLKAVGFFDDEGQFDVTEELCLALNNLEKVKVFLSGVLNNMEIRRLAAEIDALEEGPTGEKMIKSFQTLLQNAETGMRKKILEVTSVVGKKMQPDIRKYLEEFASKITEVTPRPPNNSPLNGHDSDYNLKRKEWERTACDAIGPLMNYLTTNIITLKNWLSDPNFQRVLDVLWKVCLQSFIQVILSRHKDEKPYFFKQCKYILTDHLVVFFNADEEGLPMERMFSIEEYIAVDAELRMKGANTHDLMRLFFSQMYDEQEGAASNSIYGVLNVYAYYDVISSKVKVDIISAENLLPQDINGFSDPFVQITLMPKIMFPKIRTLQTLEKKRTLDPVYENESFSFEIDRSLALLEGTAIVFTVLDYDVIGKNDLEGECVLLLNKLDGVRDSSKKENRSFRLPLTQPRLNSPATSPQKIKEDINDNLKKETKTLMSHTTLDLLKGRSHFDRDASEFCRWRKKLMDSVVHDDFIGNANVLKNLKLG